MSQRVDPDGGGRVVPERDVKGVPIELDRLGHLCLEQPAEAHLHIGGPCRELRQLHRRVRLGGGGELAVADKAPKKPQRVDLLDPPPDD